ncbi:MAG: glycerate kinase [Saprospiraceae bacterium]|nr:glycerate kinase [Saprospiraceae bacterium]
MKILIAPDKFKGSMTAREVCIAIGNGLIKNDSSLDIIYHPMADGGDGSLIILSNHLSLKKNKITTVDPIGRIISTHYFTSTDAAFIEIASASGLVLLSKNEKNPLITSTAGTGKMIANALSKGFKNIYLFLGGSATNDAGMGIASELGFQFLDKNKNEISSSGKNLSNVNSIHSSPIFDLEKIKFTLLCDVQNPMFGKFGAAHIYAPQKGATKKQVQLLDEGLKMFSEVLKQHTGIDSSQIPGAGAAGGIGGGLVALLNAELKNGFETISELTNLEKHIELADWVISGEGKLDEQSIQGKVVSGISNLCKKYHKPLSLFVGKNELSKKQIETLKVEHIFSISENVKNIDDAILNGALYLENLASLFKQKI